MRDITEVPLTGRETEIVHQLSFGKSNPEIARHLGLSSDTVRTHLRKISQKLRASGRAGIVGEAFRKGILTIPGDGNGSVPSVQSVR